MSVDVNGTLAYQRTPALQVDAILYAHSFSCNSSSFKCYLAWETPYDLNVSRRAVFIATFDVNLNAIHQGSVTRTLIQGQSPFLPSIVGILGGFAYTFSNTMGNHVALAIYGDNTASFFPQPTYSGNQIPSRADPYIHFLAFNGIDRVMFTFAASPTVIGGPTVAYASSSLPVSTSLLANS